MFGFLKFWKKKEEFPEFPREESPDMGMPSGEFPGISEAPGFEPTSSMAPEQPPVFGREPEMPKAFEQAEQPVFGTPSFSRPSAPASSDKEFQLLNAKLDAIKASIDGVHQRLDKMEMEKEGRRAEKDIYAWR